MQLIIDSNQLPVGWKVKKLVEVTDLITCGVAKRPDYVDNGIPFLSARNVKNGQVIWDNYQYISEETHALLTKNNKPRKGDILYTRVGSFGEAAIINDDFEFSIFVSLTLIKTKTEILNSFLKHYLNSYSVKMLAKNSISGSGVGNLNVGTVRNFFVPLPPIPEQKRIVAILDEAFEGIDRAISNTQKNLANSRELFKSYLNDIFTQKGEQWVDAVIEDHIKFIDYRGRTPNKTQEGMRLITAKNVKMGFLQTEPQEFVAPDIYDDWMTRGIPQKGDVLFTTEAPLGNVAQLDTDEKVVFAQRIIIMQPDTNFINKTFLKFLLLSDIIQQRIHDKATGATAQGIKASSLKKIQISFPCDLLVQENIVLKLETLQSDTKRLETIYLQKLAALNELKQSIPQKAFTGELTIETPKTVKEGIAA